MSDPKFQNSVKYLCGSAPLREEIDLQPGLPVTRFSFEMHDGQNPDCAWILEVDDRIGEDGAEMAPGRSVVNPIQTWLGAYFCDQSFNLIIKPAAQLG